MNKNFQGKILHIVNIPWYSGLGSYAEDMGIYMKKMGVEVVFAAPGRSKLATRLAKNFKVIKLPGRKPVQSLRGLFKLLRERKKFKAVISHSGSSFFIGFFMKLFSPRIRLIRTRAERGCPSNNIFNRIFHARASAVIVATRKMKKEFTALGMKPEKIVVIPPPVNIKTFYPSPPPSENIIALVGRLSPVKGHEVLLKAIPLIRKEISDIKIIFAGRQRQVKYDVLMGKARSLGVDDCIEYMGRLPEEEVAALMRGCRAGVIASLGSEAVSRVALEWMACGRALIASDVGCLQEYLKDSGAALIYRAGDFRQLANSLCRVLSDPNKIKEMSFRARETALKKFSPSVYMENLNKIFRLIK